MKLYFEEQTVFDRRISMRNISDADVKEIITNTNVEKMAIDWIGRRIFWTQSSPNRILVANLDGKEKRVVTNTMRKPRGIAIDSLSGFLFWTEDGVIMRLNLADGVKVTLVTNTGTVNVIKLDCIKKRVYWLESSSNIRHIKSSDYGGKDNKTITSGPFNEYLLDVFGDSLYFLNTSEYRIHEMNVSSGNISGTILIDKRSYSDLIILDKSIQPAVTEECSSIPCGRFGYCNKSTGLCQCEVGFERNGSRCADIDECSSLPCGRKDINNCTDHVGYYKCSCGDGFTSEPTEKKCIAYSDLKIRLVNGANNKTGRVEIFHASFGWGTVCDDRWDDKDSAVVCRQLGFDGVNATRVKAHYGKGSGPILLDEVRCTGDESYIWDCSHDGWNVHNCDHSEDVGVDCN